MAFRIFIACVLIAAGYFAFEAIRLAWLQHSLFSVQDSHASGAEDGDVKLVDFVDYECPDCQEAHPIVMQAVAKDGRVRYIPRPIGHAHDDGYYLSRLPYAAAEQDKFFEMHDALLNNYRVVDESVLRDITANIGVDFERLITDYESKKVSKLATKNEKLFKRLRLNYVPSYAVGKNILFSPRDNKPNVDDFLNIFNEARAR